MQAICSICGESRENRSARSRFVCGAVACQKKARKRGDKHGKRSLKAKAYFERLKRARARSIREGKGPDVYDL
jgi:hypothetical protein